MGSHKLTSTLRLHGVDKAVMHAHCCFFLRQEALSWVCFLGILDHSSMP